MILVLPLFIALGTFLIARAQRLDRASMLLIFAALLLYYFHLAHSSWDDFSLDASTHIEYVEHIARTGEIPSLRDTNNIVASRHPPTYYVMAAAGYRLGQMMGEAEPLEAVRNVSMACFMGFIFFSIALLKRVITPGSLSFRCALTLLLFWPIGVTMGARITCDPLLYAAQAATLYFLLRALERYEIHFFDAAFLAAGASIAAKNGGIIMLYIGLLALAFALVKERHAWRRFLRIDLAASIAFAYACYWLTQRHGWVTEHTPSAGYDWELWRARLFGFNPFLLLYDNALGLSHDLFWNMFLHTLLLGTENMPWKSESLLIVFNVLWASLLVYLLAALPNLLHMRGTPRKALWLEGIFKAAMIVAMLYMLLITGNFGYADARYAYPVVTGIALAHGLVMQHARAAGDMSRYRIGVLIAGAFMLMTVTLFIVQYEPIFS